MPVEAVSSAARPVCSLDISTISSYGTNIVSHEDTSYVDFSQQGDGDIMIETSGLRRMFHEQGDAQGGGRRGHFTRRRARSSVPAQRGRQDHHDADAGDPPRSPPAGPPVWPASSQQAARVLHRVGYVAQAGGQRPDLDRLREVVFQVAPLRMTKADAQVAA